MEQLLSCKAQGKLAGHAGYVGHQARCMIWNVGSHGELPGLLTQLPMWPFMDWSITPCIFSTEGTLASLRQAQGSLAWAAGGRAGAAVRTAAVDLLGERFLQR